MSKTIDQKQRFVEMRSRGVSFDQCSKELKTAKTTLIAWSKELKTEIDQSRQLELETLQEMNSVSKRKRIEALGKELDRINKELDKRSLEDTSTDKLIQLKIKLLENLKEDETPVKFQEWTESTFEPINFSTSLVEWQP